MKRMMGLLQFPSPTRGEGLGVRGMSLVLNHVEEIGLSAVALSLI